MTTTPNDPVILRAVRTPFGKRKGALRETRPDALLAGMLQQVLAQAAVPAEQIGDVIGVFVRESCLD